METAYRIETERLVLRCWQPSDAPALRAAVEASVAHLAPWLAWARAEPRPLDAQVARLRRARARFDLDRDHAYGVFDREEREVLGGVSLHRTRRGDVREAGYWIAEAHLRRGYATEALAALVRVAFEVEGLACLEVRCDAANAASLGVARALGFTLDGTVRAPARSGEEPRRAAVATLFAREHASRPAARARVEAFDALGRTLLGARGVRRAGFR